MRLERLTNIAIVLVCCAVIGDVAYRNVIRPVPLGGVGARTPSNPFKPGDAFPVLTGFTQAPGKSALLLVVRSGCKYCNDSVPFYQQLVQTVRESQGRIQLVGVCLESSDACAEYFKQHALAVDATIGAPAGVDRIQGTPTVVMLDERGKVSSVWVGALAPDRQRDVIGAVTQKAGKKNT